MRSCGSDQSAEQGEYIQNLKAVASFYGYNDSCDITGCLEDKVSSHELKKLWTQRLGSSYTNQKNTLRRQIDEELNDLQDLILSCIDPEPTTEKIGVQPQFLDNWCGGKSRAAASREFLSPHSG